MQRRVQRNKLFVRQKIGYPKNWYCFRFVA